MDTKTKAAAACLVVRMICAGYALKRQRLLGLASTVAGKYDLSSTDLAVLPKTVSSIKLGEPYLHRLFRIVSRYESLIAARNAHQTQAAIG